VLTAYDPYDPVAVEMHSQIRQVAVERGLQKYPQFAHDSSDACTNLSIEERMAIMGSKRLVLSSVENKADAMPPRVGTDVPVTARYAS